ncbi:MAG: LysR family transcriptional regulator [Asticcacaulis sp.]
MARPDINRSGEMEVFVRVVERGGFAAAARDLRLTPSAVSKLISRLEARLGARLINRSTRRLLLTPEGQVFYERSVRVLSDLDEAEGTVAAKDAPSGRLRISVNMPVGRRLLLPLIPDFLRLYPGIELEVSLTDTVIDLYEQRTDIALRNGPMKSSGLMARKLGQTSLDIVAAPAYLAQHGTPETPDDLISHNGLSFTYARQTNGWPLRIDGEIREFPVTGNLRVSDGESLLAMTLAGMGMSRLAGFMTREYLADGRLVRVLDRYNPNETEEMYAVWMGQTHQPARIRAFLDFLGERLLFA